MLDLLDKDFKSATLNMFKELKKTMSKELKASKRRMSHQIDKNYKKEPNRNSKVQITEM